MSKTAIKEKMQRISELKEAVILFADAEFYSEETLISYYNLCVDIYGFYKDINSIKHIRVDGTLWLAKIIANLIKLDVLYRVILEYRYGLFGKKTLTIAEIGTICKLNLTTAERRLEEALKIMRDSSTSFENRHAELLQRIESEKYLLENHVDTCININGNK